MTAAFTDFAMAVTRCTKWPEGEPSKNVKNAMPLELAVGFTTSDVYRLYPASLS